MLTRNGAREQDDEPRRWHQHRIWPNLAPGCLASSASVTKETDPSMSRLVVVSNRVAPIQEGEATAGGLAAGVLDALKQKGGLWFGWSGEVVAGSELKPGRTGLQR